MPDELHPHAFFATDEEWKAIQEFLKKRRAGESADAPVLPDMSAPSSPVAAASAKETTPSKTDSHRKSSMDAKKTTPASKPGVIAKEASDHMEIPLENGLTPSQTRAMGLLESGKNVFVTGGAGVGKTYLLHRFIENHEGRVVVCAPSGIAAKRAGGTTIHRAFGLSKVQFTRDYTG